MKRARTGCNTLSTIIQGFHNGCCQRTFATLAQQQQQQQQQDHERQVVAEQQKQPPSQPHTTTQENITVDTFEQDFWHPKYRK